MIDYQGITKTFTGIAIALLFGSTCYAQTYESSADRPRVKTTEGPVRGVAENGVRKFLGIPYAAPPVGDLRWRPPVPHKAWGAPFDSSRFGNSCPQTNELGVFAGPVSFTEDCLSLNVFTIARPNHGVRKLPVLVWIHGGGFFDGESNDYDPSALVIGTAGGPTVVVTINYRLGLLGFLAHPALDAEGHYFGNYGIMDQQEALRWVRRNIGAFGGDANNITVGGQSAGATSAAALLISPMSAGFVRRAIFQSGFLLAVTPLAAAEKRG